MYPDFDWDADYVMSDGDTGIGSWAKKIWPGLKASLQCLFHVIGNLTAKLRALVAEKTVRAELRKCLKTLSWRGVWQCLRWDGPHCVHSILPSPNSLLICRRSTLTSAHIGSVVPHPRASRLPRPPSLVSIC